MTHPSDDFVIGAIEEIRGHTEMLAKARRLWQAANVETPDVERGHARKALSELFMQNADFFLVAGLASLGEKRADVAHITREMAHE